MRFHINSTDNPITFQKGKYVVAVFPFRCRHKDLDPVLKPKEAFSTFAVAQYRVKRTENPHPTGRIRHVGELGHQIWFGKYRSTRAVGADDLHLDDASVL